MDSLYSSQSNDVVRIASETDLLRRSHTLRARSHVVAPARRARALGCRRCPNAAASVNARAVFVERIEGRVARVIGAVSVGCRCAVQHKSDGDGGPARP
jgi:hypothetical protein